MTNRTENIRWCRQMILPLAPLLFSSLIACSDATAMGKAQNSSGVAGAGGLPAMNNAAENALSAGSYQDGLVLGHRNGELIVNRLRASTVGVKGCMALPKLEQALIKVAQNITPPHQGGDQLVRGFFKGYLDSIRAAIHQTRSGCHASSYHNGEWAGVFYGTLLCKVSQISIELAQSLEVESLYDGWSGSSKEVKQECRTAANVTLKSCKLTSGTIELPDFLEDQTPDLSQILNVAVQTSCSDS